MSAAELVRGDGIRYLSRLADRSVDVMIADPPYSEHTHAKSRRAPSKGLRNPTGAKAARLSPVARDLGFASLTAEVARDFAAAAARVTKRWVLVFSDDHGIGPWRLTLEAAGLEVVRTCPWVKPNCAPRMTGDRPGAGWEAIIVAHATRSRGRPMAKRWNGHGHRGVFTHDVPRGPDRIHTTEKPIGLLLELVSLFTDPGELIVDPFAGSATTGAACIRLGRRFVGVELDAKIAKSARERLEAERAGISLSAHRAKQVPLFGAVA